MTLFHEASLIILTSMHTLFHCLLQDHTKAVVTYSSGTVLPLAPNVQKLRFRSLKNNKVKVELMKSLFFFQIQNIQDCQYRNTAWLGWLLGS